MGMEVDGIVDYINNDESVLMLVYVSVNLLSRVVDLKLTVAQKAMLSMIPPEVLIFLVIFLGVRNVVLALKATVVYSIVERVILNESHPWCVLSKSRVKRLHEMADKS